MALGISNVNVSYSDTGERCTATITGEYTIQYAGTYIVSGCILGETYSCYNWVGPFEVAVGDPATGSFTITGVEASATEVIPGYDFYYTVGDEYDVSLFTPTGELVGSRADGTMKSCDVTPPVINSVTWDPALPSEGVLVQFTGVATPSEGYSLGMWHWSFGDGSSEVYEYDGTPTHTYAELGTYTIYVRVQDDSGGYAWGYYATQITVSEEPIVDPPVIESVNWNPTIPSTKVPVQFTGVATAYGEHTIDMWNWSFGDGSIDISANNPSPTHEYLISGVRTLNVAARDTKGDWGYFNTNVTVTEILPTHTLTLYFKPWPWTNVDGVMSDLVNGVIDVSGALSNVFQDISGYTYLDHEFIRKDGLIGLKINIIAPAEPTAQLAITASVIYIVLAVFIITSVVGDYVMAEWTDIYYTATVLHPLVTQEAGELDCECQYLTFELANELLADGEITIEEYITHMQQLVQRDEEFRATYTPRNDPAIHDAYADCMAAALTQYEATSNMGAYQSAVDNCLTSNSAAQNDETSIKYDPDETVDPEVDNIFGDVLKYLTYGAVIVGGITLTQLAVTTTTLLKQVE